MLGLGSLGKEKHFVKAGLWHTEFLIFQEMHLAAHQQEALLRLQRAVILLVLHGS